MVEPAGEGPPGATGATGSDVGRSRLGETDADVGCSGLGETGAGASCSVLGDNGAGDRRSGLGDNGAGDSRSGLGDDARVGRSELGDTDPGQTAFSPRASTGVLFHTQISFRFIM